MIFEVQIRIYTTGICVYIPQELSYEDFTLKLIIQTKLLRIIYIERETFWICRFCRKKNHRSIIHSVGMTRNPQATSEQILLGRGRAVGFDTCIFIA